MNLYRHPWIIIWLIFGITVLFLLQFPKITLDNDILGFVPEDDPRMVAQEEVADQYGSNIMMSLVLQNQYESILNPENMNMIALLTDELDDIQGMEDVQSLSNVDYILEENGTLYNVPLSEDPEGRALSPEEILGRIRSWELYENLLLTEDELSCQIGLTLDEDIENEEQETLFNEVKRITEQHLPPSFNYYIAGIPSTTVQISLNMKSDLILLIPGVLLLIILILYFSFRCLEGVILPLLNVVVSTIWTLGLMGLTNTPVSILGSLIPVLMLAVGTAYGIHFVSHFLDETDKKKDYYIKPGEIVHSVAKITGIPIVTAGLTTMAGFWALSFSSVIPMKIFGIFTTFGVGTALIVALTLIPSLLIVKPRRRSPYRRKRKDIFLLEAFTRLVITARKQLIIIFAAITLGAVLFIPKIVIENNLVDYFKESTEVYRADKYIREHFGGTNTFNIIISGDESGELNHPDILLFMDNYKKWILHNFSEVTKVVSYTDYLKRINQVLHEDTPGEFDLSSPNSASVIEPGIDYFTDSSREDEWGGSEDSWGSSEMDDSFFDSEDYESAYHEVYDTVKNNSGIMTALWDAYLRAGDDFVLELARMTNHQGVDYYEIPQDSTKYNLADPDQMSHLISQFLLLYSGSLSSWSNESIEPSEAKMTVQLRVNGSYYTDQIIPELQAYADQYLPDGYSVNFTGAALIQSALTHRIVESAIHSILISIFLVFLILSVMYCSVIAGIIGIIPLSITILVNYGLMGLLGITLDISTAMVGSIAIGIGIDYTIHFISNYRHNWSPDCDVKDVTSRTIKSSGKAILFNAASVAIGFMVLIFSKFNPLMNFGFLIVVTMAVSSLSSLTLLPLILNSLQPRFLIKSSQTKRSKEVLNEK